jgi:hypothetical protein
MPGSDIGSPFTSSAVLRDPSDGQGYRRVPRTMIAFNFLRPVTAPLLTTCRTASIAYQAEQSTLSPAGPMPAPARRARQPRAVHSTAYSCPTDERHLILPFHC